MWSISRMMRTFVHCSLLMSVSAINPPNEPVDEIERTMDSLIASNKIMIFGKSSCKWCKRAKKILGNKLNTLHKEDIKITSFELDLEATGPTMGKVLAERFSLNPFTVPQIFINAQHRGGCEDLMEMEKNGELDELL
ncbi:hypothetical protein PTTG_29065 [Puccinia triticina 1-1 BBBD Race 1]|uniref:Glutaredoxin domain-containing protein n=2 Tax=Puccinia triticina TaxID=208348 RepID=A0A180G756_PUCT1|nr:uncharacterized protein PtA15_5A837 [Puccinia triticina]OAV88319.1 hypothetical protein PTTG_29065 [Puccinia triticina 1-1 BBBD Race 1]WAQ85262.1 hypothetical protein PtA15_5A837 [Puccinia triticina]WAR58584.1 hypothetical protein PtB15_5B818 [Puccinia triticina]